MKEAGEQLDGAALSGLRVVELAHIIAGPIAGSLMADLGAEVVHVEAPGTGDAARVMGEDKDGTYLWWKVSGRNKRSVTLDLRTEEGQGVAKRLAAWADVVITNFRVETLEEWGLDWPGLHAVNPKLIYLQISGFGSRSSRRNEPGFGKVGEALSGVVHLTGFPDGPPVHTGFSHADTTTGLMGAFAVLSAVYRRSSDPDFDGEWIDLALFETLFRLIEWQVVTYDQLGIVPSRQGNRMGVRPAAVVNTFLSSDDVWVTVTSATPRSVRAVIELLGLSWDDYDTTAKQRDKAAELDVALRSWIGERKAADVLAEMRGKGVVASTIYSVADIVEDETYDELGDILTVPDRDLGELRMQGVIPRLTNHAGHVWRTGPDLGSDNEHVYRDLVGIPEDEYEALRKAGVI